MFEQFTGELKRVHDLAVDLHVKLGDSFADHGRILALDQYTGNGHPLGNGTFYNTFVACKQLTFALALSNHPGVHSLAANKEITCYNFQPESLIELGVLQDMKILDLGCGYVPSFARCARAFGADVYTVDVVPAKDFQFGNSRQENIWFDGFTQRERDIEIKKHIQGNLHDEETLEQISNKTGNCFDLVTAANIKFVPGVEHAARFSEYAVDDLAMRFLARGGICYVPDCFGDPVSLEMKE